MHTNRDYDMDHFDTDPKDQTSGQVRKTRPQRTLLDDEGYVCPCLRLPASL